MRVCENVQILRKLRKLKTEHQKNVKMWFLKKVESKKKIAILSNIFSIEGVLENGVLPKVRLA
jgi:hypothetical protein